MVQLKDCLHICMANLCVLNQRKVFLKEIMICEYKNKGEQKLFQNFKAFFT